MHLEQSTYGAYTGGVYKGADGRKSAYQTELKTELVRSARAYMVRTKCMLYALNQDLISTLTLIY